MEKKKLQSVSIAALIVSILPLAALAPPMWNSCGGRSMPCARRKKSDCRWN